MSITLFYSHFAWDYVSTNLKLNHLLSLIHFPYLDDLCAFPNPFQSDIDNGSIKAEDQNMAKDNKFQGRRACTLIVKERDGKESTGTVRYQSITPETVTWTELSEPSAFFANYKNLYTDQKLFTTKSGDDGIKIQLGSPATFNSQSQDLVSGESLQVQRTDSKIFYETKKVIPAPKAVDVQIKGFFVDEDDFQRDFEVILYWEYTNDCGPKSFVNPVMVSSQPTIFDFVSNCVCIIDCFQILLLLVLVSSYYYPLTIIMCLLFNHTPIGI